MSNVDATLPLQKAIVQALKDSAGLTLLVNKRVYDKVPPSPTKPYISIGPIQSFPENADEYEGGDTRIQIDAWSVGSVSDAGSVEVKKIGRLIWAALNNTALSLDEDQRLVNLTLEQTRYLLESDGTTQHAVVIMRARTEPTS